MASVDLVPEKTTVLVIGGGPAGSYSSTLLAREGIDVVLLEAVKHPREHVGESMVPSMRHYLQFIDLEEDFEARNFTIKPGAAFKFVHGMRECYTDFSVYGPDRLSWNVLRAESDDLMLRHAARQGVKVFEETRVETISFSDTGRPVSAVWKTKSGQTGTINFEWLIDASGRQGLMSTKYLKNRIYRQGLKNVAAYGYWKDITVYDEGGPRSNAPWFECLTDKLGWVWYIPLHNGTSSVGVVMHQDTSTRKKAEGPSGLEQHYLEQLKLAPGLQAFIGEKGTYVPGTVKSTADYSYRATSYSGDHYRIAGDAAAFVDPLFSSGVHIAMTGALSAAATILGSMKGQVTETEAQSWHNAKIGICQTRFLMVVLSAYRQMQHQGNRAVLEDVESDNFEAAFTMFRPIYQGEHDRSTKLTNEEFMKMIEFTRNLWTPTTRQQVTDVRERVGDLADFSGPLLAPEELDNVLDADDSDAKAVLRSLNSLKILRSDTTINSFSSDEVNGYVLRLERGQLGLVKA